MSHIYWWEPVSVIALVLFYLYLRKRSQAQGANAAKPAPASGPAAPAITAVRPRPGAAEDSAESYSSRRRRALEVTPEQLGLASALAEDEPYVLVMEMGISNSVVTLACFANGDASLLNQNGGGMIGGISHEPVRKAAREFLAHGRDAVSQMAKAPRAALPADGRVRFHAVTPLGLYSVEVDREELGEPGSEFSALFYAGQAVVTQMREVQSQRAS
jgi:hypothetical protein